MRILRTPDERFAGLQNFPWQPNYLTFNGMRIHYVDTGESSSGETILCLHGEPTWSYLYRKMIPQLSQRARVIAFDFIGFGRSDKYSDVDAYSYYLHANTLESVVKQLNLRQITLVVQDWGGILGLPFAARHRELISRLVVMNTGIPPLGEPLSLRDLVSGAAFVGWRAVASILRDLPIGMLLNAATYKPFRLSKQVIAGYEAPFPTVEYKAGAAAFPALVPFSRMDPGATELLAARRILACWSRPALVMFGDKDPIFSSQAEVFERLIPAAERIDIPGAGHFLQEDRGEELAERIVDFIQRNP